ncbi:hypothetical protein TRFO_19821 [Tritrichomonas foetus]|uniref:Intraflagellar transport protein n=1 Tax=Tritrichomonas foetus TaxID=1144522 RepID=A0A1J4KIF1_9EUKA|nr:hypothetical protein TRFO_19821 [Tritrichomonas foetus]|eukprot:OHT10834.1 hypothetical protein TRFO_19821 [Tritrichomonas foetus]
MNIKTLSKAVSSTLPGVDGMITSICLDDRNFYVAVDGGAIRKYPINSEDLGTITDDVFALKQSHITCIDSTRDSTAQNTFVIGCSDGNFHVCSTNWRVEKTVSAHKGGVTCIKMNPDGSSIATGGEDGILKIWSRNGIHRSNLASCGSVITSINWDCTGKYVMFTHGGMITVRSASFKQDQTQFRAHRRLITCSDWDRATNEIISGGEDRHARIYDTDGRLLAESPQYEYAVSNVAFISHQKLCLIGTANRLYLTDNRLRPLCSAPIQSGSAMCASYDVPKILVGGNDTCNLITVVGKKVVYKDVEVVSENPKSITVYDLKNGISEILQFQDSIVDFYLNFNNLIVTTAQKIYIYKSGQWTTPVVVDIKEPPRVIAQSQTMFILISLSGVQIIGYDGRTISRINDTRVKWDLLSQDSVAVSPAIFAAINPDGRKHIFAFSTSTGQMITSEPLNHASEIKCIRTNQATTQTKARFGFVNANGDLTVCRFVASNPRLPPSIETEKIANFVDDFVWHSSHDIILARSGEKLTCYSCPSAAFFTPELMPMLKNELRMLFDAAEIKSFDGIHIFAKAKDGALCCSSVSPFLIMIYEAVEMHRNWKVVLQICRASNDQNLWAVCAACAVQAGDIDAAQEAYAALSLIDRVMFLGKVKKMKSPAAKNAMIAVLQGRASEAEDILIQGGCIFRAIKMNISMHRWEKALALAKRTNKFQEVVAAYRTKYIKDMGIKETIQDFITLGEVEFDSVKEIIQKEKAAEYAE